MCAILRAVKMIFVNTVSSCLLDDWELYMFVNAKHKQKKMDKKRF